MSATVLEIWSLVQWVSLLIWPYRWFARAVQPAQWGSAGAGSRPDCCSGHGRLGKSGGVGLQHGVRGFSGLGCCRRPLHLAVVETPGVLVLSFWPRLLYDYTGN